MPLSGHIHVFLEIPQGQVARELTKAKSSNKISIENIYLFCFTFFWTVVGLQEGQETMTAKGFGLNVSI